MKIVIVGAGISGLSALYYIQRYSDHEVELFEREDRIGGDAYAVPYKLPGKKECQVDLAFLLFNERGWPNLVKLFHELGVEWQLTTATFSFSGDDGRFEWASHSLKTVFGKWTNLLNPNMWRLMWDIWRFNNFAIDVLRNKERYQHLSVADYLQGQGYSRAFAEYYFIPLVAEMWSGSLSKMASSPIIRPVEAFHTVGALQLYNRVPWYSVKGGTSEYLRKIVTDKAKPCIHTNSTVESVAAVPEGGVELGFADGSTKQYDQVILAVSTECAQKMLAAGGSLSPQLNNVFSQFTWTHMELVAHSDERLMPKDRANWSGWNAMIVPRAPEKTSLMARVGTDRELPVNDAVSCTFSYNEMLNLPISEYGNVIVSAYPHLSIDESKVVDRKWFAQWSSTPATLTAMRDFEDPSWRKKNIPPGIDFAGAWQGLGYHEDGLISSFKALRRVGVPVPDWEPRSPPLPALSIGDKATRGIIQAGEGMREALAPVFSILAWIVLALCQVALGLSHQMGWEKKRGDIEWLMECWAGPDAYKWAI